jgi:hypothetical protein
MNRGVRYFFGRLNLIPTQAPLEKRRIVLEALLQKATIESRGVSWGFYKVREVTVGELQFVHGFLVKYRPYTQEEVAVPETRELDEQTITNRVSAKARFFLHISSGLIAYHPVGRDIRRDTFRLRFCDLFQAALGNFFVDAEIQSIEEPFRIAQALMEFEKVSRISIYLHPANPDITAVTERIQARLLKLKAETYRETYESNANPKGLNVREDQEVVGKISMAEDGYGRAEVTGIIQGEEVTVTTADSPIIAYSGNDEVPDEQALEGLLPRFRRIFDRYLQ